MIAGTPHSDPAPVGALAENLRTFRVATWLGWQIEGNWADPLVFFIFTVLRPVASALILVVMYQVIAGGVKSSFFDYLFISNALFVLVIQVLVGMSWAIIDDRENYKMLKYIYTSPARQMAYLGGRAVAKAGIGLLTTLLLLTTGVLFLGLHLSLSSIEWGWLGYYSLTGLMVLFGLGLMLAGVSLVIARHGASIGEVVGGMVLLFSGAYFPPDILPPLLRTISMLLPVTYWLEGMRRALEGGTLTTVPPGATQPVPISPLLASFSDPQLAVVLAFSAIVCLVASYFFYRFVEHAAKERGMIDRLTGY